VAFAGEPLAKQAQLRALADPVDAVKGKEQGHSLLEMNV
jgi:hypothetical protein